MFDNGMMIEGGGPMLTGNWVNPKTGDFFTVRDSFFEDDDCIIITTDGRRLNYKLIQDYVGTKDSVEQLKRVKESMGKRDEQLPPEVANLIDDNPLDKPVPPRKDSKPRQTVPVVEPGMDPSMDYDPDLQEALGNYGKKPAYDPLNSPMATKREEQPRGIVVQPQKPIIQDADIIERAMRRVNAPKINISMVFDKYPEKQLDMLVNLMGCEYEDIAAWIYESYFSKDFRAIIIKEITKILENGPEPVETQKDKWEPPFSNEYELCKDPYFTKPLEEEMPVIEEEPAEKQVVKAKPVKKPTTKKKKTKK